MTRTGSDTLGDATITVTFTVAEYETVRKAIAALDRSHEAIRRTRPDAYDPMAHARAAAALIALRDADC